MVGGNGTNDMHNSLFSVSGNQLLVAGNIDYETNSSLSIYVQVSDGVNASARALTIDVNDVNNGIVSSGGVDWQVSASNSDDGGTWASFYGLRNFGGSRYLEGIYQQVSLTADKTYTISFEMSHFGMDFGTDLGGFSMDFQ